MNLTIEMLGPLQVRLGGAAVAFRTDAERILLAYLAAHQGNAQRRDTLAGLLSPERSDVEALTYLRNRLTRLRAALRDQEASPAWLLIDRKQIALRSGEGITIDLVDFEQHLATVEQHAHRQLAGCPPCLARLEQAVELLRGELLAGLNFPSETWEIWLATQREHYQQQALAAMTLLREARMARGEWAEVLEIARRQISLEPWLEAAWRAVMLAHYQLGDRNAALAQYEYCQQGLWDELGVEPEEETQQLHQRILNQALIVAGATSIPDNLTLESGQFFGREAEQTHLLQLLVNPAYRLISIVGAGGMGKTRLAIELGRNVKASFPDGVYFVALDALRGSAEQIKIAIAEAVGLQQDGKQLTGEQVLALLRTKRMLLIFDNCDLLFDELAFIPEWLKRAAQLAILATSREPLNFAAESVLTLNGLPIGEAHSSAAEAMFAEHARLARADFVLSDENLPQVQQICTLLDGSPLAIALAAAWLRRRSLKQIRAEIERSLDFLSTRLRDIDPRHHSMRAVFEASWQLLTLAEQRVLAALSVFPSSFTAEAAAAIAGATLTQLDTLCEKSLLQQWHEPERYLMHNLLRQFAADKLAGQAAEVNRSFASYFYSFARKHQNSYHALQPEWHNLAAAISRAHELEDWQLVLDMVQVLDKPWFRQIRFIDMRAGLQLALEAASAVCDQSAQSHVLLRLGEIEIELNDYAAAESHLRDALDHCMHLENSLEIAQAKYLLGRIKNEQAQDEQALELFEESVGIFESEHDLPGIAKNLNLIAVCHVKKYRDFQAARTYLERSVALQQHAALSSTYIETLRNLARVSVWSDDFVAAEYYLTEASRLSQQLADIGEYAAVLYERVLLCKRRQHFDDALRFGYQCLDSFQKMGSLRWEALIKTQLGLLHQARQQYQQAAVLLNEGLDMFHDLGDLYEQAYSYYYLFRLYAEQGQIEPSLLARQHALQLNAEVHDPQLTERLEQIDSC